MFFWSRCPWEWSWNLCFIVSGNSKLAIFCKLNQHVKSLGAHTCSRTSLHRTQMCTRRSSSMRTKHMWCSKPHGIGQKKPGQQFSLHAKDTSLVPPTPPCNQRALCWWAIRGVYLRHLDNGVACIEQVFTPVSMLCCMPCGHNHLKSWSLESRQTRCFHGHFECINCFEKGVNLKGQYRSGWLKHSNRLSWLHLNIFNRYSASKVLPIRAKSI